MDNMDIDKDIIDELVNNIKKLSFFSDEHEYMRLYKISLIEVEDIESESNLSDILDSALKSINFLSQGKNVQDFAIDVVWKEAQKNIFFARPKLRIVKQRASHSDIEGQFQDIGV